jgi:Flp pilus assembly protein TadG
MIRTFHRAGRAGRSRSRAQALVEFAIVAPIFFLILFGIIDFGRYVYYTQILNNAAREGARYAIVHGELGIPPTGPGSSDPTGNAVRTVVKNYAIGVISLQDPNISVAWDPPNNKRNTKVSVLIAYDFHSVIPVVPIPPITVRGASTLVINN